MILQEISSKEEKQPEITLQTLGGLVLRERGRRPKQGCSQKKIQNNIKRSEELPVCFVIKCSPFHCLFFPPLLYSSKTQTIYNNDVINSFVLYLQSLWSSFS